MTRYFSLPKKGVVGKEIELTEGQFDVEIGDIIARTFDGSDDQYDDYCNDKEPELVEAAGSLRGLDAGDYVLYAREDSNYDDISLEYKHFDKPVYLYDGIAYDTLDEAINGREN